MNNKQVLERVLNSAEIELGLLQQDITKLKIFLERDNYLEIVENEPKQAELLKLQLETMEQYSKILISRIALLQDQIEGENIGSGEILRNEAAIKANKFDLCVRCKREWDNDTQK